MNGERNAKDGRVVLLERLLANAQMTRMSKKTTPETAKFAADLEADYARQIEELSSQQPAHEAKVAA